MTKRTAWVCKGTVFVTSDDGWAACDAADVLRERAGTPLDQPSTNGEWDYAFTSVERLPEGVQEDILSQLRAGFVSASGLPTNVVAYLDESRRAQAQEALDRCDKEERDAALGEVEAR